MELFEGKEATGSAKTGLNFISYKEDVFLLTKSKDFLNKTLRRYDKAPFPLDRLHNDTGDILWRYCRFKKFFKLLDDMINISIIGHSFGFPIHIRKRSLVHFPGKGAKPFFVGTNFTRHGHR